MVREREMDRGGKEEKGKERGSPKKPKRRKKGSKDMSEFHLRIQDHPL